MFGFNRNTQYKSDANIGHTMQFGGNTVPSHLFETPPTPLQIPELQKNWNEFISGMQMLYKQRERITASVDKIACANLQLLHSNLRASAYYKDLLHDLKQYTQQHTLFYHCPLTENYQAGCSIVGYSGKAATETSLKELFINHIPHQLENTGISKQSVTYMYLVINGKLLVSRNSSVPQSLLSSLHEQTYSISAYKSGDVLLMRDDQEQKIIDIRSDQKNTQLFGVYIAENTST